ncbi:MAG TPA: tRNA (adenosine(37)-N6)-threonylcarbamoyltransferase complex dimerization subunit type 1 TsaB [Treponema sp.]|nr:tRNA (adenosine(37)-N6)-threonylcarbamoyltransferase complex dimerization subunit type 1 TsaB [Treponema sp.]
MNTIAIDTVTQLLSVTAAGPAGTCTVSLENKIQHAETLIGVLETAIAHAGFSPTETERILCAEGPGSFTGLRIAYSTAKAIQLASSCPLLPIPTLLCYAYPFRFSNGTVVSILDAKKSRFYAQLFKKGKPLTEELDCTPDELVAILKTHDSILLTGPDAPLFQNAVESSLSALDYILIPYGNQGISQNMIHIALQDSEQYTQNIYDYAGPRYVRKSDAETKHG